MKISLHIPASPNRMIRKEKLKICEFFSRYGTFFFFNLNGFAVILNSKYKLVFARTKFPLHKITPDKLLLDELSTE